MESEDEHKGWQSGLGPVTQSPRKAITIDISRTARIKTTARSNQIANSADKP